MLQKVPLYRNYLLAPSPPPTYIEAFPYFFLQEYPVGPTYGSGMEMFTVKCEVQQLFAVPRPKDAGFKPFNIMQTDHILEVGTVDIDATALAWKCSQIAEILGGAATSGRNLYDKEVSDIKTILMQYKAVRSSVLAENEYVEIDSVIAEALRLVTGQCYTNISAEREIRMKNFAADKDCKVIIARVKFVISITSSSSVKYVTQTHFLLKRSNDDGFTVRLLGVPGFAKSAVYSRFMRERALRGYGSDWKSIMMNIGRYCFSTINEEIYEIISLTGMRQTRALALKVRPETTLIGRTDREDRYADRTDRFARQRLAIAMLLHRRLGRDSIFMTVSQTLPFQDIIPTVGRFLCAREVIYQKLPSYGNWTDTDSGYAISAVDRPGINRITGWLVHCRQEEKKQAQLTGKKM